MQAPGSATRAGPPQPGEQGWSRANPRAGQSWERSQSSLPLDPIEPHHSPWPLQTLAMSLLCKQPNKLFEDRQAWVWLQWGWGETGSWACPCPLSLWAPGPLLTQGYK